MNAWNSECRILIIQTLIKLITSLYIFMDRFLIWYKSKVVGL